jgi:hypothetical protein
MSSVGDEHVEPARSARHAIARKIKPQYTEGELRKVGWARNQAEAELLQGMLLEEGVPSVVRRTRGADVPDFLAAGPRDILVPEAAVEHAAEILDVAGATPAATEVEERPLRRALAITAAIVAAAAATAAITWLALQTGV